MTARASARSLLRSRVSLVVPRRGPEGTPPRQRMAKPDAQRAPGGLKEPAKAGFAYQ
jgi:hypothetical protein